MNAMKMPKINAPTREKREHAINDMFHKISTKTIQVCKKAKIKRGNN